MYFGANNTGKSHSPHHIILRHLLEIDLQVICENTDLIDVLSSQKIMKVCN